MKIQYPKNLFSLPLLLIIFSYLANNLLWAEKSPLFFYRDSIMNIRWAIYYGKALRNEGLFYNPQLVERMESSNIKKDDSIYYPEQYSPPLKGPISGKEAISLKSLLQFRHPPLWFIYQGGLFWLFGLHPWVIHLGQTILGGLTLWLTYLVAKKFFSGAAGLLSALILSTLPSFLIITRQGFLEALFCPVFLIGIILLNAILQSPSRLRDYLFFGAACGLGMLIKSAFLLYAIILFLTVALFRDKSKLPFFSTLKNLSLFLQAWLYALLYLGTYMPTRNSYIIPMNRLPKALVYLDSS